MRVKVGKFLIEISDPYPCWIEISFNDCKIRGIPHNKLSDLNYAIQKTMAIADNRLKESNSENEVYVK